jgi:hypothetical protein
LLNAVARWIEPADDAPMLDWARGLRAAMEPFSTGAAYVNFLGLGDDRVKASYDAGHYTRLAALKAVWDPMNVFHLNQNVPPAPTMS